MHERLASVGLATPRTAPPTSPTLGDWLDLYIKQRSAELKPRSIVELEYTAKSLRRMFGDDRPIDTIKPDDAHAWRASVVDAGVAEATTRKHTRNAKTFFNVAVELELISRNPFRKLASASIAARRDRYVTPEEADVIVEACPNIDWRVLFGLARFAGLRVPSETHILTWADVDFDKGRMDVFCPKNERYEKHRRRFVPITDKLMAILQDAYDAAEVGCKLVCGLARTSLHRRMGVILKRAEIDYWKDCFQTLRRSCDTEWKQTLPSYAVDAWLGHSQRVSEEHYLMIPDDLWERATKSAAYALPHSTRTPSQGVASGIGRLNKTERRRDVAVSKNPSNIGNNAEIRREVIADDSCQGRDSQS